MVVHQIQQTTWRGNHHIGAAAQRQHLGIDGYTAKYAEDFRPRRQIATVSSHGLADLNGQLPRRHQH